MTNQQQETLPQFTLCRDTGALAVGGTCPIHGGDACLFDFIRLVDSRARLSEAYGLLATTQAALAAAETARDEAIARATRFYETATRAVTSRHAAETALRRADKIASKAHDAMWAMDFDKTSAGSVERRTWVGLRKIASDHIHKLHGVVRPVLSASPDSDV